MEQQQETELPDGGKVARAAEAVSLPFRISCWQDSLCGYGSCIATVFTDAVFSAFQKLREDVSGIVRVMLGAV